jgi:hypothetical protein
MLLLLHIDQEKADPCLIFVGASSESRPGAIQASFVHGATGMAKFKLQFAAAVAILGCSAFARADSITFRQDLPLSPVYNTGGVTIRNDATNYDVNQNAGSQFDQIIVGSNSIFSLRGLLEFDLSALEAAVAGSPYVINSVSLTLNSSKAGSDQEPSSLSVVYDLNLLGNNLDFKEEEVTWKTAPSTPGGTVGALLSSTTFRPNNSADFGHHVFADSAAFRSAVRDALDNEPNNTIRLMLKADDESGQNFARFDSDEAINIANHPALTINYTVITPLPGAATAGLFLMGGVGLRRSRRRA